MRCSSCGSQNPSGRKFCSECGIGLPRACLQCGADNGASAKFCGDCGTSLNVPTSAPVPKTSAVKPREIGGERRHLTVMFCDLVASTEISARLHPAQHPQTPASQLPPPPQA